MAPETLRIASQNKERAEIALPKTSATSALDGGCEWTNVPLPGVHTMNPSATSVSIARCMVDRAALYSRHMSWRIGSLVLGGSAPLAISHRSASAIALALANSLSVDSRMSTAYEITG